MPPPIGIELRTRIVEEIRAGATRRAVAQRYGVSVTTAQRLLKRMTETGDLSPDRIGGYKRSAIDPYEATLRTALQDRPTITLDAMRDILRRRHGLSVSSTAMHAAVRRLGLRPLKAPRGRSNGALPSGAAPPCAPGSDMASPP